MTKGKERWVLAVMHKNFIACLTTNLDLIAAQFFHHHTEAERFVVEHIVDTEGFACPVRFTLRDVAIAHDHIKVLDGSYFCRRSPRARSFADCGLTLGFADISAVFVNRTAGFTFDSSGSNIVHCNDDMG